MFPGVHVARTIVDLLWRDHPAATTRGARGPRAKVSTTRTVEAAVALADADGLGALTLRRLAAHLGVAVNALYTHVGSRDDLLVLMADTVRAGRPRLPWPPDQEWPVRVRHLAHAELETCLAHTWLLDVTDQRTALGPGTIATYDHQLHALDGTALGNVERDAALTFLLDFVHASARSRRPEPHAVDMATTWADTHERLGVYVGDAYPLARRVGAAAGAAMQAPYSAAHAWSFGLERVLDALHALVGPRADERAERPWPTGG